MRRAGTAFTVLVAPALLHIHIHLHLHHRFHGPPFDYVGLGVAVAASWIGLPGPGEPALFAAAVLAAHRELDLTTVVAVAWLAATGGGIIGWAIGLKAGRALVTGRGPMRALRIRTVARGEELFDRHPVIAILLTPAFLAGIHRAPSRVFQPINAVTALGWAVGIGVGGYFIGPPVLDGFGDLGVVLTVVLIAGAITLVAVEIVRRRRRSAQSSA